MGSISNGLSSPVFDERGLISRTSAGNQVRDDGEIESCSCVFQGLSFTWGCKHSVLWIILL